MSFHITIRNPGQEFEFRKEFNNQSEWESSDWHREFESSIDYRWSQAYPWAQVVVPIRVHHMKGFVKDFFLPNTVNLASKVNYWGVRTILILVACFFVDLVTFPIRLLTALPWKLAAPKKENHPLYQFLKDKVSKDLLSGDYVNLTVADGETREDKRYSLRYIPWTEFWV